MSEISIDSVSERFQQHLDIENNFRIIFSGKYGIGKTFFLNNFFDKRHDKYNKIVLSPVNYAISSNENIFELIKADILKDLFLTGKIDLTKLSNDTLLQKISKYIENNPLTIPHFLLKNLSKLNPLIETPLKLIEEIGKMIEDFKKKSKSENEKSLSEEVADYLSGHEEIIGSIYEHNYITKAINVFLNEIRADKRNVLIIDDMDRIDPEHLFRILNILSAHNNQFDSENKFAFDHVILVCDIENVTKIFEHKYGSKVDFDGYIDKFFSTEIFHFYNKDAILFYLGESQLFNFSNQREKIFIIFLLEELVKKEFLTVRKLMKSKIKFLINEFEIDRNSQLKMLSFKLNPAFIKYGMELTVVSSDFHLFQVFKIMSILFGDFKNFEEVIEKLSNISEKITIGSNQTELLKYLLLQKHLLECEGLEKYFTYEYLRTTHGKQIIPGSENWPKTRWNNSDFEIQLKWSKGKVFDGTESYFNDAEVLFDTNKIDLGGFSYKTIFSIIKLIIVECKRRDLLGKIPIV